MQPLAEADAGHVYHLFVVRAGGPDGMRDRLQRRLLADGIETLVHYPIPIPRQAAFSSGPPDQCPEAVAACVSDGVIDHYDAHRLLLVTAVWLDPKAGDEDAVFHNQRSACGAALRAGASGGKPVHDVLDAADGGAWNHFFRDRS